MISRSGTPPREQIKPGEGASIAARWRSKGDYRIAGRLEDYYGEKRRFGPQGQAFFDSFDPSLHSLDDVFALREKNYGGYVIGSADLLLNLAEVSTIFDFHVTYDYPGTTLWVFVNGQQVDWFPVIGSEERVQEKLASL